MQRLCAIALVISGCVSGTDGDLPTDDYHGNSAPTTIFTGPSATGSPFFASLGTNGRSCGSCHVADEGWTVTPTGIESRFDATNGTDPIFRTNDGSVSPNADVSSVSKRKTAYAMLLSKGLIRIGLPIPAGAEFTLAAVDDPYNFASATQLSLFRRPLPSTNLGFLSAIMWDGREPSLGNQAIDATLGHAQATGTQQSQMDAIVAFESSIFTAQALDPSAGRLDLSGGNGGPDELSDTSFYIGINDPIGKNPTGAPFNPNAFTLYDAWGRYPGNGAPGRARAAIYRGQQLFNTLPISITGVAGLNDVLGVTTLQGTCTTCHDTPNVGNHSVAMALNIGIADASRRTPDMPLYTLKNIATGATVQTTDPGKALITGKWADIGKFKGPILRGVGLRAPYFHNGSQPTLDDVVDFYDTRFGLGLSSQQHSDLVAFLEAL
jgi:cytochrome c peroxidase